MKKTEYPGSVFRLQFDPEEEPFYYDDPGTEDAVSRLSALAGSGKPGVLLLCAPSGSGKSHLVRALLREKGLLPEDSSGCCVSAAEWIGDQTGRYYRSGTPLSELSLPSVPAFIFDHMELLVGKTASLSLLFRLVRDSLSRGTSVLLLTERLFPELETAMARLTETEVPAAVVRLSRPGPACRRRYAEDFLRRHGLELPPALVEQTAEEQETIFRLRSALLAASLKKEAEDRQG